MSTTADHWTRRILDSPHALWLLFLLSFGESIILPVPMELVLLPYMIARPGRLWAAATVTLAGCTVGALLGYSVGYALFETAGNYIIETLGYDQAYGNFRTLFSEHGFWAIVMLGILPVPFQVAMLGAGSVAYSIPLFLLATFIARGVRYFGLAWLAALFGDRARKIWRDHALALSLGLALCFVFIALLTQWVARSVI